jgi:hypothetical protein
MVSMSSKPPGNTSSHLPSRTHTQPRPPRTRPPHHHTHRQPPPCIHTPTSMHAHTLIHAPTPTHAHTYTHLHTVEQAAEAGRHPAAEVETVHLCCEVLRSSAQPGKRAYYLLVQCLRDCLSFGTVMDASFDMHPLILIRSKPPVAQATSAKRISAPSPTYHHQSQKKTSTVHKFAYLS